MSCDNCLHCVCQKDIPQSWTVKKPKKESKHKLSFTREEVKLLTIVLTGVIALIVGSSIGFIISKIIGY